jgi:thioredoxin reductase (NADPH)
MEDVIIIGAGPCGLSAAMELQKQGIEPLVIEKGCIVNSIYHYPTFMEFFSTPELLEVGNTPFMTTNVKPTRYEALNYYRTVASRRKVRIHTYEKVTLVEPKIDHFYIKTEDRQGQPLHYEAKQVVMATGYYDNPNMLNVPGEDLPKVSHYFKEAHPYQGLNVAVVGGKNSAVDAAMELERAGAKVTMIYRGEGISEHVKAWVRPVISSMIAKGRIQVLWKSKVKEIAEGALIVEQEGNLQHIDNDYVFALTGYRPNRKMLTSIGVNMNPETNVPEFNPETMESNVSGLYIAGVLAAGHDANVIFIENGRLHGEPIAKDIARKLK